MLRTAAALAAVSAALLVVSAAPAASPAWTGTAFHPYSVDPSNADCLPWSDPVIGTTRNCDPINLIFPGQALDAVVARLHAQGWTDTVGSIQWLYAASALIRVQAQLAKADGPDPTQRYHIRLWEASPGLTVGNVHHEHGEPHHIDMAWDEAESFVAAGVCTTWCQHVHLVRADSIQGPNGLWRGFASDGDATVVPIAPPPVAPPPVAPPPVSSPPAKTPPAAHKHRKHRKHRPAVPG
jgi:hypothetical protein